MALTAIFLIASAPIQRLQAAQNGAGHSQDKPNKASRQQSPPAAPQPAAAAQNAEHNSAHASQSAADEAGKHDGDVSIKWTDKAIVGLTVGLVMAGLLQFSAALLQWNAMIRQERQMRRSVIEARRASNRQSREVQAQIALSRKEFVSTHRPKIILREAIIGSVMEGEKIKVFMTFANIGETGGTIVRSVIDLEIVSRNFERLFGLNSVEPFNETGDLVLAPGESRLVAFDKLTKRPKSSEPPVWSREKFMMRREIIGGAYTQPKEVQFRNFSIHLVGQFLYEDEAHLRRRTAFRRELNPERQRFYRLEGEPDLDYAD